MIPDVRSEDNIHPDSTAGVLTVPLKGYEYSSRCKCTLCSLTDSRSLYNCKVTGAGS